MGRSVDGVSLPLMFAIVLLFLAKAMAAAERNEPAVQQKFEQRHPPRPQTFMTPIPAELAKKAVKPNGSGPFSEHAPDFVLKDPHGTDIKARELYKNSGMLIMITVPNLTQYEKQKRWERWISKQPWPVMNGPQRVLLEDLSQQVTFKDKARGLMKASYKPEGALRVLIDENGDVRRQFGIQQNETVILLVDRDGKIVHHECDEVEPDQSTAQRLIAHVYHLANAYAARATERPKVMATILSAP